MPSVNATASPFSLLAPPYRHLANLPTPATLHARGPSLMGTALVWEMARGCQKQDQVHAEGRPGGVALIVVLPPAERLHREADMLDVVERCRPQSLLPFHPQPDPQDLAQLLARPPGNLPHEVTDYLVWRGLRLDGDTRRLIRKTLEMAGELQTIGGLARALYVSRRALGRRFMARGLPVPSHWLQFGRLLRVAVQLQNSSDSLFAIATASGYADGFALSNQMYRLTGVRPSSVRERLGWEWFVEAWLEMEVAEGGLALPPRVPTHLGEAGGANPTPALHPSDRSERWVAEARRG